MYKRYLMAALLVVGIVLIACSRANTASQNPKTESSMNATSIYDFTLKSIDGKEVSLAEYKGKKMLLVNVASKCGYTPQYKDLQEFYSQYGDKVVVLGFPANNFGGQEPGSNAEIAEFCSLTYGVSFPMFEKISVKGSDQHPLYQWLAESAGGKSPSWNFCKYLVSEDGTKVEFFGSSTNPAELIEKL
jgi:glutathione peroxidase